MVKRMGSVTDMMAANDVQLRIGDVVRWGRNKHSWYILVEDDESIIGWIERRLWAMYYAGNITDNPELQDRLHVWKESE